MAGAGEDEAARRGTDGPRGRAGLGRRGRDRCRFRGRRAARSLRGHRPGEDRLRVGERKDQEHGMNQDMIAALRELEREKGIAFETILAGLEEALASAYKTYKRQHDPDLDEVTTGVRTVLDPETGEMRVWMQQLDEETQEILSEQEEEVPA